MKKALLFFLALVPLSGFAVTEDLVNLIPAGKKLPGWGQVRTGGIADSAVTTAKIANSNVTTAKIADTNVTTAKIADGALTQVKRAALGQQVSGSSGTFNTTSTTPSDVTNLSVSITTTGRPVFIGMISDGSGSDSGLEADRTGLAAGVKILFLRGSTEIARNYTQWAVPSSGAYDFSWPGTIFHIDVPAAGTYTYKVQAAQMNAGNARVVRMKLVAFEL